MYCHFFVRTFSMPNFRSVFFGLQQIDYLGHVISAQVLSMDSDKIQAVLNWPLPTTVTQLRGFVGLTGCYRRFVRNFAIIASPLTDLLKKMPSHGPQKLPQYSVTCNRLPSFKSLILQKFSVWKLMPLVQV